MQLIECAEHASQGSLVSQLALQGGDRGTRLHSGWAYRHTSQKIRNGLVEPALHTDLVGSGEIEGDWIPG